MYAGMAMRLAVDVGLHLDSSDIGMSSREVEIRRMVRELGYTPTY